MTRKKTNLIELVKYRSELKSKVEKFHKMGYPEISEKELLEYLVHYRWPKTPRMTVARKKKDILDLHAWEFFDYQRLLAVTSKKKIESLTNIKDLF